MPWAGNEPHGEYNAHIKDKVGWVWIAVWGLGCLSFKTRLCFRSGWWEAFKERLKKGSTCTFVRPCLLCVLFRPEVVVMLIGGCLVLYGLGVTVEVSNTGRIPLLGLIGGATEG